ncbi:MAG: N-acetylmuramoyl-L-alanine amidase [Gemmatimonadaceae bacterium]
MIALLLAAMLLQQPGRVPASLVVRDAAGRSSVPIVTTRLGAMVRADDLLTPLGAVLLRATPDRYRLVVGETEIELTVGMAFARVRGVTQPLAAPPTISQGQLFLPLSLVTDLVPRLMAEFTYDPASAELRRSGAVAGTSTAADSARRPPREAAAVPPARAAPNATAKATPPPTPPERPPRKPVIVIDAGHGGRDRGMSGPIGSRRKVHEADITLSVARRLREALLKRGVDVVMTRSTDTLIALHDRGRIANRARGDVFLSIHVNAANPRWRNAAAARGFETYFLSEARTDDERRVADLENEAVKYEVEADSPNDDPLSFILNDMKQNEFLREASALAQTVQRTMGTVHPGTNRGVKQAGFRVLVGAFMPAALVEIGFGTNPAESSYLSSAAGQNALATAIADATMSYLASYGERRTVGAGPAR